MHAPDPHASRPTMFSNNFFLLPTTSFKAAPRNALVMRPEYNTVESKRHPLAITGLFRRRNMVRNQVHAVYRLDFIWTPGPPPLFIEGSSPLPITICTETYTRSSRLTRTRTGKRNKKKKKEGRGQATDHGERSNSLVTGTRE